MDKQSRPKENVKQLLRAHTDEIKRQMGVLGEEFQERLKVVAGHVVANSEHLEIIKQNIEFIKSNLQRS